MGPMGGRGMGQRDVSAGGHPGAQTGGNPKPGPQGGGRMDQRGGPPTSYPGGGGWGGGGGSDGGRRERDGVRFGPPTTYPGARPPLQQPPRAADQRDVPGTNPDRLLPVEEADGDGAAARAAQCRTPDRLAPVADRHPPATSDSCRAVRPHGAAARAAQCRTPDRLAPVADRHPPATSDSCRAVRPHGAAARASGGPECRTLAEADGAAAAAGRRTLAEAGRRTLAEAGTLNSRTCSSSTATSRLRDPCWLATRASRTSSSSSRCPSRVSSR